MNVVAISRRRESAAATKFSPVAPTSLLLRPVAILFSCPNVSFPVRSLPFAGGRFNGDGGRFRVKRRYYLGHVYLIGLAAPVLRYLPGIRLPTYMRWIFLEASVPTKPFPPWPKTTANMPARHTWSESVSFTSYYQCRKTLLNVFVGYRYKVPEKFQLPQ